MKPMIADFFEKTLNPPRPRLVPVIAIEDAAEAIPLGRTLLENGLPIAEVTFRTKAAGAAIRQLAALSELMLGAGTVLSVDQVQEAFDAGAQFMVTPGFNPKVVDYCIKNSIPIVPGVCTPTEIEAALEYGLDVLKFFPAESMGGVNSLKALSGPYSRVKFIPTGGINTANVGDYLNLPNVLACGGSWMVGKKLIASKNYSEIARLTREAVLLCRKTKQVFNSGT
jgi:2-dehydro-3-deoxyphosphogluconate aldolase/(4S)-4-hydroxy-2-oxoglutarate aldolase